MLRIVAKPKPVVVLREAPPPPGRRDPWRVETPDLLFLVAALPIAGWALLIASRILKEIYANMGVKLAWVSKVYLFYEVPLLWFLVLAIPAAAILERRYGLRGAVWGAKSVSTLLLLGGVASLGLPYLNLHQCLCY